MSFDVKMFHYNRARAEARARNPAKRSGRLNVC